MKLPAHSYELRRSHLVLANFLITVKTESGDIVTYSGNPAELPGIMFETRKAMKRAGAFTLLIKHNASRLKNGIIRLYALRTSTVSPSSLR